MDPSQSNPSRRSTNKESKLSTPYDANYQQRLIDGGILPYGYEYSDGSEPPLPPDWEETNKRLQQRRPSLSASAFSKDLY
jgi:hypothetical protein